MKKQVCITVVLMLFISSWCWALEPGINIVTYHPLGFRVDNTEQGERVKRLLLKIRQLGIQVLILNFRGRMITGRGSEIDSDIPESLRAEEEYHIRDTVAYAKKMGFEIAFRPILLVVGPNGEFPYVEGNHYWWHGNIEPRDPTTWFEKYFKFHERYLRLANEVGPKWYSLGAEMHSMTSGLGSRYPPWRFGFPKNWVELTKKARAILSATTQITYGINFTDQYVLENGNRTWGGEFAQWRHDITFGASTSQERDHQNSMRELWRAWDFVGLDYYRALGRQEWTYPNTFNELANKLTVLARQHADQIRKTILQISTVTAAPKQVAIQEIGYQSVEKCFVAPYHYEGGNVPMNYIHQAAAWEALLRTANDVPFIGIGIWQVLVDEDTDLFLNRGFSPLGKEPTSSVLKSHFIKKSKRE